MDGELRGDTVGLRGAHAFADGELRGAAKHGVVQTGASQGVDGEPAPRPNADRMALLLVWRMERRLRAASRAMRMQRS